MEEFKKVNIINEKQYLEYKNVTAYDLSKVFADEYASIKRAITNYLSGLEKISLPPEYNPLGVKIQKFIMDTVLSVSSNLIARKDSYPDIAKNETLRDMFALNNGGDNTIEKKYYEQMVYFRTFEIVTYVVEGLNIPDRFNSDIIKGFITASAGKLSTLEQQIITLAFTTFTDMNNQSTSVAATNIKRTCKIVRNYPDICNELVPTSWLHNPRINDMITSVSYWEEKLTDNEIGMSRIKNVLTENFLSIYYATILGIFNIRRDNNTSKFDYWMADIHRHHDRYNINVDMAVYSIVSQLCNAPDNIVLEEEEV